MSTMSLVPPAARVLCLMTAVAALVGCSSEPDTSALGEPSFAPINADGSAYAGSGDYANQPWACVRDDRTGLVWEVKSDKPGLHYRGNTYSWYLPEFDEQPGTQNQGSCTGSGCDTQAYAEAVNQEGLCGFNDWRVPKQEELGSLHDQNVEVPGPRIDRRYFPNAQPTEHWTASEYATYKAGAWCWNFQYGHNRVDWKSAAKHLRLVRGEPKQRLKVDD